MQVLMDHIQKKPLPPSRRIEDPLPAELDRVILSCLEKDPNNRPQSTLELIAALRTVPLRESWTEERARHWWLANGSRTPDVSGADAGTPSDLVVEVRAQG